MIKLRFGASSCSMLVRPVRDGEQCEFGVFFLLSDSTSNIHSFSVFVFPRKGITQGSMESLVGSVPGNDIRGWFTLFLVHSSVACMFFLASRIQLLGGPFRLIAFAGHSPSAER